jgi:hypothetical protein
MRDFMSKLQGALSGGLDLKTALNDDNINYLAGEMANKGIQPPTSELTSGMAMPTDPRATQDPFGQPGVVDPVAEEAKKRRAAIIAGMTGSLQGAPGPRPQHMPTLGGVAVGNATPLQLATPALYNARVGTPAAVPSLGRAILGR